MQQKQLVIWIDLPDLDVIDWSSWFYQRLHVQYVSVFTCMCLSLSLHFLVVYLFWIGLVYYLYVAKPVK